MEQRGLDQGRPGEVGRRPSDGGADRSKRTLLNQPDIEHAEKLALEAESLAVVFPPDQDNALKVRKDALKAREDAKTMLTAARTALGRDDYDAAERYAKQSEKVAGPFTFSAVGNGDSPAKARKELQALRNPANMTEPPGPIVGSSKPSDTNPPPAPLKVAEPPIPTPAPPPTSGVKAFVTAQPSAQDAEKARALVQEGRRALAENKLDLAKRLANQAKALKANLTWSEDTPEKLLVDIARAEAKATPPSPNGKPDAVVQAGAATTTTTESPNQKLPTTKEDALALVKSARMLLAENKIEDAQNAAFKARAVRSASWGLFEDSPDSVLKDIEKARVKRDKEEAVKVLAEGRQLLEKGDWEARHTRQAYRAQKLHGPYGIWDLGDRPEKLLADAQALRAKAPKKETVVVKRDETEANSNAAAQPDPGEDGDARATGGSNAPANARGESRAAAVARFARRENVRAAAGSDSSDESSGSIRSYRSVAAAAACADESSGSIRSYRSVDSAAAGPGPRAGEQYVRGAVGRECASRHAADDSGNGRLGCFSHLAEPGGGAVRDSRSQHASRGAGALGRCSPSHQGRRPGEGEHNRRSGFRLESGVCAGRRHSSAVA